MATVVKLFVEDRVVPRVLHRWAIFIELFQDAGNHFIFFHLDQVKSIDLIKIKQFEQFSLFRCYRVYGIDG